MVRGPTSTFPAPPRPNSRPLSEAEFYSEKQRLLKLEEEKRSVIKMISGFMDLETNL